MVSVLTCKSHERHHSCPYKKKWDKLKIYDFWTHLETNIAGQNAALKSDETGSPKGTQPRSSYLEQKPLELLYGDRNM